MADTELVDVVNEDNVVIGYTDVRTAHEQKLLHRVVGIFLFDSENNLILQSGNKFKKFDLSVGGHVRRGESYEDAAIRELEEELGLTVPVDHVSTFIPSKARFNHYWAIYTAQAPGGWIFSKTDEVSSVISLPTKEINRKILENPDIFTHGFINTYNELIATRG